MQTQTLTKEQKEQQEKMNNVMGWLIAFSILIQAVCSAILPVLNGIPFDIVFSFSDREVLKKQDVWKKSPIAWGWCLISPVYLYKRTILLKDSMTKFWIHTILYCLSIISIIVFFALLAA